MVKTMARVVIHWSEVVDDQKPGQALAKACRRAERVLSKLGLVGVGRFELPISGPPALRLKPLGHTPGDANF